MDDKFIKGYMDELLGSVRKQVVCSVIGGFERVSFDWLREELNGIEEEVSDIYNKFKFSL